ncbi:MAG: hypothetical protein LC792_10005 [Actinobacteria bacterium]|nr:hypothetical protein [Actinomycetota bacterium]
MWHDSVYRLKQPKSLFFFAHIAEFESPERYERAVRWNSSNELVADIAVIRQSSDITNALPRQTAAKTFGNAFRS